MFTLPRKSAELAMDATYTMELPAPWDRESAMAREFMNDGGFNAKNRFHVLDVWHAVHLGIGKAWIASGVQMLQKLVPESNVEKRISVIANEYRTYCKHAKLDPVIRKIDIHTFGGSGEHNGSWNKASITTNFFLFLEEFCKKRDDKIREDERLRIFASLLQLQMMFLFVFGVKYMRPWRYTFSRPLCVFFLCMCIFCMEKSFLLFTCDRSLLLSAWFGIWLAMRLMALRR